MKTIRYVVIPFCAICISVTNTKAAVLIVDTFDQAPYFTNNQNHFDQSVNLPLANRRAPVIRGCPIPGSGAVFESSLDTSAGTVSLFISGTPAGSSSYCRFGLSIAYADVAMHDITGYTGFMLGFTSLSGTGSMYVEVGGEDGLADINSIGLTGAGDFYYPLDRVYENVNFTKDSFNILIFTFKATSPEFSFTLDEIRLVPEASSSALLGATLLFLGSRRTRKPGNA